MLRTLATFVFAAAPLAAQFDFDFEKRTSARLGSPLVLEVVGATPLTPTVIVPSMNAGPTPLAAIDPLDPRLVAVGIDLLDAAVVLATDSAGGASLSIPLPLSPAVAGSVLHWQPLTVAFGATLFGQIGNNVVVQAGMPSTGVLAPAPLLDPRAFAAAFVDADNNASASDVVISGGGAGTLTAATGLASTEVWDHRGLRRVNGPNMSTARALHLAVPLTDGRVLLIGGADQNGVVLSSCEVYNPASNTFATTGSMGTPRILHAACRLADGRVMVAGGTSTLQPDVLAAISGTLNSVEIWNPTTGNWSAGPSLGGRRLAPALSRLPNGQVMVSGGVEVAFFFGVPVSAVSTNAVQRWNPATNTWSNGPNMAQGRAGHQYNQVQLNDGRILLTGGVLVPNLLGAANAAPINGAEVYNPTNNTWAQANMPTARALHTATVLADGRVAVCGGAQGTLLTPVSIDAVHVFEPATNSWTTAPALTAPRAGHAAVRMADGTLVLFGGQDASTTTSSIETIRF